MTSHKSLHFLLGVLLAVTITGSPCLAAEIPQEFLERLKSEEFKIREEAQNGLLTWARIDPGSRVEHVLEQARSAQDPEVRQRTHNVLRALAMDDYLKAGEGFVGIQMNAIRAEVPGEEGGAREVIVINRVLRDTPAREAGLRVGDMIVSVNGEKLAVDGALASFQDTIRALKPATKTTFGIIRNGDLVEVELTLGRRPPEQQARFFGQGMPDMNELAKLDQERFFREWLENLDN